MRKTILTAALLLSAAMSAPALADTVDIFAVTSSTSTLTLSPVVPGGNQPRNHPCLICGTNQPAQPAGFGYNNFDATGNVNDYLMFSTATVGGSLGQDQLGTGYSLGSGAFLAALAGNTQFAVGIDVNDTNQAQILESFYFLNLTQRTVLASFSPGPGGVPVLAPNNGTGFPDYTLTGFDINRGDIRLGDQIIFFARWSNANDGPESFFLVPLAVPGPMVGAGIPGLIAAMGGLVLLARRRRDRSVVGAV
jgi:hypothetical protein